MSRFIRWIGLLLLLLLLCACQPIQAEAMPQVAAMPSVASAEVVGVWMMEGEGTSFYLMLEPDGALRIAEGSPTASPLCVGSYHFADGKLEVKCEAVDATGCTATQQAVYTVMATQGEGQAETLHFTVETVELCTDHRFVLDGMTLTRVAAEELPVTANAEVAGVWMLPVEGTPYFLSMTDEGELRITSGTPAAAPLCVGSYRIADGKLEMQCETVDATGCTATQQAHYTVMMTQVAGHSTHLRFALETVELCTDHRFVLDGALLTRVEMVEMPVMTEGDIAGVWQLPVDGEAFYLILEPDGALRIAGGAPDAAPLCVGSYRVADGKLELQCETVDATGCTATQLARYAVMMTLHEGQPVQLHFALETVELCTDHRFVLDGATLTVQ